MNMEIPVIDIFAGPGGLGEGFSSLVDPATNKRLFKIVLSIEKEVYAHQTLTLRSFFRQFPLGNVPEEYYKFLKGQITIKKLYDNYKDQAEAAMHEAWRAELGEGKTAAPVALVDKRIKDALKGKKNWVLIGGPPCQAYSIAGRSRRREKILDESKDERVGLYKQYLRIIAVHNPAVFVMENVKGLLSAKTYNTRLLNKIIDDLSDPVKAYVSEFGDSGYSPDCNGYKIYSLVTPPRETNIIGDPVYEQNEFVIKSEDYGIPQTRHRVILLGIRRDIDILPGILKRTKPVPVSRVLTGLPKIRSALSLRNGQNGKNWEETIKEIMNEIKNSKIDPDVQIEILKQLENISESNLNSGGEYLPFENYSVQYMPEWFMDNRLRGICNHSSRSHMGKDLLRYFYVSCFAKVKNRSPKLEDFPDSLLPNHKNVKEGILNKKFADRFRVQLWDEPAKTITSHIAKDGHYYIHPDPVQCRSLTVREAARIQTFPDNYYFCGPRTAQYIQVGNAVPPLLARQIAKVVYEIFKYIANESKVYEQKLRV